MKLKDALRRVKSELKEIYDDAEASQMAYMLMESITGIDKNRQIAVDDVRLQPEIHEQLEKQLSRLKSHEPIQYVIGKAWFYGLELFVNQSVLIPRPETEELVQWVIKEVEASHPDLFQKSANEADQTKTLKILDIGTGSGCIALALKKNIPAAEVWGCDKSESALNIARRNGAALDIRVDFQGIDFLEAGQQKSLPTADVIVSNPPYVMLKEKEQMRKNVVDYEPHEALFVPNNNAMIFYQAIANFGHHRLYDGGKIYFEINEALAEDVVQLFRSEGYRNIEVRKDLQGKERMVKVGK